DGAAIDRSHSRIDRTGSASTSVFCPGAFLDSAAPGRQRSPETQGDVSVVGVAGDDRAGPPVASPGKSASSHHRPSAVGYLSLHVALCANGSLIQHATNHHAVSAGGRAELDGATCPADKTFNLVRAGGFASLCAFSARPV